MHVRRTALAAALIVCAAPASAATSSVDAYGTTPFLPSSGVFSGAADIGTNLFSGGVPYVPLVDSTWVPGAVAQIAGAGYTTSARTDFGTNQAYASATAFPGEVFGAGSFSGWYDQVTITGGTGIGTAQFSVRLTGTVDVGAFAGGAMYTLGSSSLHPSQLTSDTLPFNVMGSTQAWAMEAVNPIAGYSIAATPYNDPAVLLGPPTVESSTGIPALSGGGTLLEGDMGFPSPDLILTPGAGQFVDVTLHGTLEFTYGEAFYLVGGLGATVFGDGLTAFCDFQIGCTPPVKDGTGATTLNFANSAHLVGIVLPEGASASFDSGAAYNVTAVPEPAEWAMLLAGLGLVGWRARRRSA